VKSEITVYLVLCIFINQDIKKYEDVTVSGYAEGMCVM